MSHERADQEKSPESVEREKMIKKAINDISLGKEIDFIVMQVSPVSYQVELEKPAYVLGPEGLYFIGHPGKVAIENLVPGSSELDKIAQLQSELGEKVSYRSRRFNPDGLLTKPLSSQIQGKITRITGHRPDYRSDQDDKEIAELVNLVRLRDQHVVFAEYVKKYHVTALFETWLDENKSNKLSEQALKERIIAKVKRDQENQKKQIQGTEKEIRMETYYERARVNRLEKEAEMVAQLLLRSYQSNGKTLQRVGQIESRMQYNEFDQLNDGNPRRDFHLLKSIQEAVARKENLKSIEDLTNKKLNPGVRNLNYVDVLLTIDGLIDDIDSRRPGAASSDRCKTELEVIKIKWNRLHKQGEAQESQNKENLSMHAIREKRKEILKDLGKMAQISTRKLPIPNAQAVKETFPSASQSKRPLVVSSLQQPASTLTSSSAISFAKKKKEEVLESLRKPTKSSHRKRSSLHGN